MRWLTPTYLKRRAEIEIERVQRYAAHTGLYRNDDDQAFLELHNRFKNQPGFVIGNGPSLSIDDLDRIHAGGWPSIASNKIYLAFENTSWRPDLLTVADKLVVGDVCETWRELDLLKIAPAHYRTQIQGPEHQAMRGRNIFFRTIPTRRTAPETYRPKFSHNPLMGIFVGQTVTVLNIQLAYWLGCDPIYLIGIDGKYTVSEGRDRDRDYGTVAVTGTELNHFHDAYRKPGVRWSIPQPDLHEKEYEVCARELHHVERRIYNASRKSWVKAFQRLDLDDIFNKLQQGADPQPKADNESTDICTIESSPFRGL